LAVKDRGGAPSADDLAAGICWADLTEEKIAAIPLLSAQRSSQQ
jgi:hypothetical protein